MPEPMWRPSSERIAASNLAAFCADLNSALGTQFDPADYEALYRWSIEQPAQFWQALLGWSQLQHSGNVNPAAVGLEQMRPPQKNGGPYWFPNVELNFAQNLLGGTWQIETRQVVGQAAVPVKDSVIDGRQAGPPVPPLGSDPAIIAWNESGRHAWLTWDELRYRVLTLRQWLADRGVTAGDRVAGFMPNIPETVIAMLAATSLGAAWSSCSPDFGVQGVLDRFGQIKPKVLFCADGYQYNGKYIDSLARVREFLPQLPSVEHLVVCEYLCHEPDLAGLNCATYLRIIVGVAPARPLRESAFRLQTFASSPSTTPSTLCTPLARPGCRSAWCTARAGRCSSTTRSSRCTPT